MPLFSPMICAEDGATRTLVLVAHINNSSDWRTTDDADLELWQSCVLAVISSCDGPLDVAMKASWKRPSLCQMSGKLHRRRLLV